MHGCSYTNLSFKSPIFPHCLFKMCKYFYITYRALYRRLLQLHHLSSLLIPLHSDNIEWLIVLFHTFYPNCCFCLKYLPLFLPLFYLSSRLSTSVSSTRKPSKTSLGWAKYCPLSFHIYCACYAPCSYHTVVKLFTCTSKALLLGPSRMHTSHAFSRYLLNCGKDCIVFTKPCSLHFRTHGWTIFPRHYFG